MEGPRKGKMKSSPSAKTIAYGDKRSRPGLYYGGDNLVPVYGKDGKIIRWIEKPSTVHPTKT